MADVITYRVLRTLEAIEARAKREPMTIYYAFNTCWWGTYTYRMHGAFPSGPRGELLMQTDDAIGFLDRARHYPEHYGKHGLKAFEAALNGNIRLTNVYHHNYPWSFRTWDSYNRLLDDGAEFTMGEDE